MGICGLLLKNIPCILKSSACEFRCQDTYLNTHENKYRECNMMRRKTHRSITKIMVGCLATMMTLGNSPITALAAETDQAGSDVETVVDETSDTSGANEISETPQEFEADPVILVEEETNPELSQEFETDPEILVEEEVQPELSQEFEADPEILVEEETNSEVSEEEDAMTKIMESKPENFGVVEEPTTNVDFRLIDMAYDDIDAETYDAVVKALERITTPQTEDLLCSTPEALTALWDGIEDVPINEYTFPDPVLRTIMYQVYDQDYSGVLEAEEIFWTTNIHCEATGVRSLDGIEVFVNLQGLWCKDNYISEIDVTPFKDLRGLWCSNNPISEIDITQNKELVWIYCFDCDLSELDVSNNPHMAYIEINTNPKLKELDVTSCPDLEQLTIGSCDLESINLQNNGNLAHLDIFRNPRLKKLNLTNNTKMKRLDIWENPYLGTINTSNMPGLQYYNCASNNVTEINLSNNPEITSLNVAYNRSLEKLDLSNLPKLCILHCEDCAIKKMDLSHNPNLRFFYGAINKFNYVDFGNNPSLIKTIQDGVYDNEDYHTDAEKDAAFNDPKNNLCWWGQVWTLDFGGDDSTGGDSLFTVWINKDVKYSITPHGDFTIKEKYSPLDAGVTQKDCLTREMGAQILYEMAGCPSVSGLTTRFTDVPKSSPYYNAIVWAEDNAMVMGYPDFSNKTFGLGKWLTRQDLMFMLMRYSENTPGYERSIDFGRSDEYKDYFDVDYNHWEAVCWNATWTIVAAKGDTFGAKEEQRIDPYGIVSNKEMTNALNRLIEVNHPIPGNVRKWNPPEAPTGLVATNPSSKGASDGKILGVNKTMEYSTDPDFRYDVHAITSTTVTGLKAAVYYVRVKETNIQNPGHVAVVVVSDVVKPVNTVVTHTHGGNNATYHAAVAATCTTAGNSAYYSCSCGKYFSDKACTKEISKNSWVIAKKGHNYGAATYKWSSDYKTVTGTRVCKNDANHVDTEKVTTTYKVIKAATETATGTGRYTATFTKSGFKTQTKDVTIAKLAPTSKDVTKIFTDVKKGSWYVSAIQFVYDKGIMSGVSKTSFGPDTSITREMFVTVLYNLEGKPNIKYKKTYSDVPSGEYYSASVTWASQNSITKGIGNGKFGTGQTITREQMATMLYNYAQIKKLNYNIDKNAIKNFPDKKNVSDWATDAIKWAVTNKIMSGKAGSDGKTYLQPDAKASRAECAQMIKNLYDNLMKH